jgi:hypothetical protein
MAILTLSEALDRANRGEPIVPAAPKHLKRWTRPRDYFVAEWSRYYSAGVGQSRDSDCLEQSNFAVMLHELGGESDTVIVVRESHGGLAEFERHLILARTDEGRKRAQARGVKCQERTLDCNAANDAVSAIALMFDDPPFGTSGVELTK